MRNGLERLRGGDLRSTGVANDVALEAIEDPALVPILFKGMTAEEPVVRMRCADALEKATREHPELLQSCAAGLLALLTPSQPKEVLWHVLQMTPPIRWPVSQSGVVLIAVERCLGNSSSIVKACAMQAVAELAAQREQHLGHARKLLRALSTSGTLAMRSRGSNSFACRRG